MKNRSLWIVSATWQPMAVPQVIPAALCTLCRLSSVQLGDAGKIDAVHSQGIHTHLCINGSSALRFAPIAFKHRVHRSLVWQGEEEHPFCICWAWVSWFGRCWGCCSVLCAAVDGIWLTVRCCSGLWGARPLDGKVSSHALLVRKGKHVQESFIL